jgi:hypothetical protein
MKRYYYVSTRLTVNEWDEMIVSQDDPEQSITPHILIWPEGEIGNVEEWPMFQVHHRKYFGMWEKVHYSYTYLPDHLIVATVELEKAQTNNLYPPGFIWKGSE